MKQMLSEYGRVLALSVIVLLFLLLFFFQDGIMNALNRLKPDNPTVTNEGTKMELTKLASREKPVLGFTDPGLVQGQSIRISKLVTKARDADGRDLKSQVVYYLEDGTVVDAGYQISAKREGMQTFRFYVEDAYGVSTKKTFAIVIRGHETPDAEILLDEWEIGVTPGTVWVRMYQMPENGDFSTPDGYLMLVTGTGKTKGFTPETIPWGIYANQIRECRVENTVRAEDVSYWFQNCSLLEYVPELKYAVTLEHTFENCISLKSGIIPDTAVNIKNLYRGCTSLTSVAEVPESVQWMDGAFYGCEKLRGEILVAAAPYGYTNCFYKVASRSGDISLKVFSKSMNAFQIQQMVEEESYQENGSQVVYLGISVA